MRSNTRQKESPGRGTIYRRREDVELYRLDDEAVLYDPRHGAVHRVTAATLRVWDACDRARTVDDLARSVHDEWSGTLQEARRDVGLITTELFVRDLLEVVRDGSSGASAVSLTDEAMAGHASRVPMTITRRAAMGIGAAKVCLVAPVVSTFFAGGVYASGPSGSAAFGVDANGGCKTVLYSCAVNTDCCEDPLKTACENNVPGPGRHCCIQTNEPCTADVECCNNKLCTAGTCQP